MEQLKRIKLTFKQNDAPFWLMTDGSSAQTDKVRFSAAFDGMRLTLRVHADEEIELLSFSATLEHIFSDEERIFLNGYQSWTDSIEHTVSDKMRGLDHIPEKIVAKYAFTQYGDYNFQDYANEEGIMHGWTYGYIRNGAQYILIGSLNENSGFTCIETDTANDAVLLKKDCGGLYLTGDYTMEILIVRGTEAEVFDAYFDALKLPPVTAKPVFGYTSWYRHYQDISEQKLMNDLLGLHGADYKADVFQIDDGWQTAVGDWLSVDALKFPNGMQNMADAAHTAGHRAGLWLAPFVCEENSEVFREHKEWLVTDENGNFVKGGSNWSGFYALDLYNEEVRTYLRDVFETVIHAWGFQLLKLDFLYAVCIQPRKNKTRGMIMADAMDFLREITQGAEILGCGVPLGAAFGKVEYCRIGCDVSLDWDDKPYMRIMHRERISTKHSLLNSVFRRQLDGRAFRNDPDVFLLRHDNIMMSTAQKQCLAEVNALTGSVLFTSDDCAEYNENQEAMLRRLMLLRESEVTAATLNGDTLTLRFTRGGRDYTKQYTL